MPTSTYEKIEARTLASATNSVTFSTIPQTYTDLVLVIGALTASPTPGYGIRVGNGSVDSGSNYSYTRLYGNGSSASSDRAANVTDINGAWGLNSPSNMIVQIQNYSNTTTYKSFLTRINESSTFVTAIVSLWRSTAAINTVNIFSTNNYPVGSTFSLYGIKAA